VISTGPDQAAKAELTQEGLAALGPGNACDTEPIHLSGQIQGHGVLLVVDPSSTVVTAASTNASRLSSSAGSQLGAVLADVIGADAAQAALSAHTTGNPHDGLPVEVKLPGPDSSRPQVFDMVAHQRGLALVLEVESLGAREGVSSARMYQQQRDAVNALHQVDSVQAICELTVERVRLLTGYDRVMIYRFAPDAHGQVIAEACATGLTPFLGLHYPATDMDVAASMTISLIVDNQLWGLIACHHRTPKRTGHLQRLACEA